MNVILILNKVKKKYDANLPKLYANEFDMIN